MNIQWKYIIFFMIIFIEAEFSQTVKSTRNASIRSEHTIPPLWIMTRVAMSFTDLNVFQLSDFYHKCGSSSCNCNDQMDHIYGVSPLSEIFVDMFKYCLCIHLCDFYDTDLFNDNMSRIFIINFCLTAGP